MEILIVKEDWGTSTGARGNNANLPSEWRHPGHALKHRSI
jgi:hypothetical protein